jgi:hypothetical protein
MRGICLLLVSITAFAAETDVNEIVRRSLARDLNNVKALENYTYQEVVSETTLDSAGKRKKTETKVFDYLILGGSRFKKMVEEDGKALAPDKARKEQERMDKAIAKRRDETPELRKKRLDEDAKRKEEAAKFRTEIMEAYRFTIAGEEAINGRKCWKVLAEPKPNYEGKTRLGKILNKMHGAMWISQNNYEWMRVEAETLDKITFGGFLASLGKGATFRMQQMRVNDELWHPEKFEIKLNARALMVKANIEVEGSYRNFRKFQTDSRILAVDEVPTGSKQ